MGGINGLKILMLSRLQSRGFFIAIEAQCLFRSLQNGLECLKFLKSDAVIQLYLHNIRSEHGQGRFHVVAPLPQVLGLSPLFLKCILSFWLLLLLVELVLQATPFGAQQAEDM
jgi:hypothetical protein